MIDKPIRQLLTEFLQQGTSQEMRGKRNKVVRVVTELLCVDEVRRAGSSAMGTDVDSSDVDVVPVFFEAQCPDNYSSWLDGKLDCIEECIADDSRFELRRRAHFLLQYCCTIDGIPINVDIVPTCSAGISHPERLPLSYRIVADTPQQVAWVKRMKYLIESGNCPNHCKAVIRLLKLCMSRQSFSPPSVALHLVTIDTARTLPTTASQWDLLEKTVERLAHPERLKVTWDKSTHHPAPVVLIPSDELELNVYENSTPNRWSDQLAALMKVIQEDYSRIVCD